MDYVNIPTFPAAVSSRAWIQRFGRSLHGGVSRTFDGLRAQLLPGEELVGVFNNGLRDAAPIIATGADFDLFNLHYRTGGYLTGDYWAVPRNRLDQIETGEWIFEWADGEAE